MFGDIPLCGDEPYDDELEDAGAERPEKKKKKKKRKAAEVDFEAISSAGWSETASLAESELGKKLESERLTRLEEEAARKAAKPEPVVSALAAAEPSTGDPKFDSVLFSRRVMDEAREEKDRRQFDAFEAAKKKPEEKKPRETYDEKWIRKQKMGQQDCSSSAHPAWLKKADHWSYD